MVGLLDGLLELPCIDLRVEPVVELRMAQEDQVVDGYHAADIRLADAKGQFAAQSVIDLHTIVKQVFDNAFGPPPGFGKGQGRIVGIAKRYVVLRNNLSPQLVTPLVGGIEAQVQLGIILGDIVHQRPSVVAQSCAVAHNPFRVVSYLHLDDLGAKIRKID